MKTFPLTITSVSKVYYSGEALSLTLQGSEGELTILAGHEDFVTTLQLGVMSVVLLTGEREQIDGISDGGILEIHSGIVTVLL
jgi:F-type H+-transporting ATPase subunit epsilon